MPTARPSPPGPPGAPAPGARARVRAELSREIADAGRAELATVGPAALSLRSVARRVGMAPSALYRYYDSRDHLLTALVVDAYEALAVTAGRAARGADDPGLQWLAVGRALRRWARRHPHEWALVFGSPVPGFVGSDETTAAAMRLHTVAIDLLVATSAAGRLGPPAGTPLPAEVAASVVPMEALLGDAGPAVAAAGILAWAQVLGLVSLELFGHFANSVLDFDAYFDHGLRLAAGLVGLVIPADGTVTP